MANPDLAAESVLDDLAIRGPEDLRDLELIAWERGAVVRYEVLDGSEARIAIIGRRAIITISSRVDSARRQRFSIAHELGHLEVHRRNASMVLCHSEDLQNWLIRPSRTDLEAEANEFAAALLLPERFFAQKCVNREPSLEYIASLADEFRTSLMATAIRYTRFTDEPAVLIYSQGGYVNWFRPSQYFAELKEDLGIYIETGVRLVPDSLAGNIYGKARATPGVKQVPASAWFASERLRNGARIEEHCIPMPNYDAVLSLLWVNEEIEQEDELW